MTDSEDDVLSSNVYSFPVDRTVIHAKGPNYTNISTFSCRNNFLTSTLHPSRCVQRRNVDYDQRSLYYKRDTSPMSLSSVPNFRPRNFHHPFSVKGAGYGRSGSPTSVRSIDTNISMSATDIALAIKNEAYDKHGLHLIKEALNKQFKKKLRRKVEKRRNQRLLHMSKRRSGDDSGEQGSDSSISSDDCRSIKTVPSMANSSKYKKIYNLPHFKMTVSEDNMYKDCTKEIQRKSLKNVICSDALPDKIPNQMKTKEPIDSNSEKGVLLKDRFKNGFSLPLERFNKTSNNASLSSRQNDNNVRPDQIINGKQQFNGKKIPEKNVNEDIESEQEEILSEITAYENNFHIDDISHKRTIDLDELHCNPPKKSKVVVTESQKGPNGRNCIQNNVDSEFIFAKPQMPVRKSSNSKRKSHSPEKLISKSQQSFFDTVDNSHIKDLPIQNHSRRAVDIEIVEKENGNKECDKPAPLNGDLSMQPSFIKRKLFTQKLDVAEKKNMSDSSLSSSPQVRNISSNKEKHKARKLASSQSCLSRDVLEEDNNFLDLLHKIVPADQINITNATNKTACNRNSQRDSNDKWDITSVISTCLDKDISDTYTDEEIFKIHNKSKIKKNTDNQNEQTTNCKIVLEKLPLGELNKIASNITHKQTFINKAKECHKGSSKVMLKSFWDTDTESELENYDLSCNVNDSQNSCKVDNGMNKMEHFKKQQNQKATCVSVEVKKTMGTKSKAKKETNVRNVNAKNDKRKSPPESKESNNNLINKSCSSDRHKENINNLTETSKTVTLVSHRMGRPKRQVKPKKIFSFDSPLKDSDNSIKETEKPTETSKPTTLTSCRSSGRSKSHVKSNMTHCIESPLSKSTDNSTSNLNISIKSLRSYGKNKKLDEKQIITRHLKTRKRSGVKGI